MSRVYDKMGKHDLALIHAKEAYKLSPSNNVLLYHVGTVSFFLFSFFEGCVFSLLDFGLSQQDLRF